MFGGDIEGVGFILVAVDVSKTVFLDPWFRFCGYLGEFGGGYEVGEDDAAVVGKDGKDVFDGCCCWEGGYVCGGTVGGVDRGRKWSLHIWCHLRGGHVYGGSVGGVYGRGLGWFYLCYLWGGIGTMSEGG